MSRGAHPVGRDHPGLRPWAMRPPPTVEGILGEPVGATDCHCLCGVHLRAKAAVTCQGLRSVNVQLTGGVLDPVDVPMCTPCASWWITEQPQRVAASGPLP